MISFFIIATLSVLVSSQSIPLGCYVWNPNGNDQNEMKTFEQHFVNFTNALGVAPTHMNTFIDYSQDWNSWVKMAQWDAWSWAQSKYSKNLIPVVGIPMMPNSYYNNNEKALNDVAAGTYDSVFSGIAAAFRDNGYTTIHARIGWEANGNWYAWNWNGKNSTGGSIVPQWNAAFQRIAKALRSVTGMKVLINWNPTLINWSPFDIASQAYPGDNWVDVISLDIYSTLYPGSLYDWAKNDGTVDANLATWLQSPVNREHGWDYPAANQWDQQSLGGWGLIGHFQLAKKHNKPIAFSETGVGINPSYPQNGVKDDTDFPYYLRKRINSSGLKVAYINIWDVNAGDGTWQFSDGLRPSVAAAWRANFGANTL